MQPFRHCNIMERSWQANEECFCNNLLPRVTDGIRAMTFYLGSQTVSKYLTFVPSLMCVCVSYSPWSPVRGASWASDNVILPHGMARADPCEKASGSRSRSRPWSPRPSAGRGPSRTRASAPDPRPSTWLPDPASPWEPTWPDPDALRTGPNDDGMTGVSVEKLNKQC